jgi:hypothetical protein
MINDKSGLLAYRDSLGVCASVRDNSVLIMNTSHSNLSDDSKCSKGKLGILFQNINKKIQ